MSGLELLPIGTLLSLVIDQVMKTADAVNNVVIEKECFNTLSQYLLDVETILKDLQHHELIDSQILRQTLEFLRNDCNMAFELLQKYENCGWLYSFLFCHKIAKEMQDVTRKIGKSLATLPLANTELLYEIYEKLHRLQAEMQKAEFVVSQRRLRVLDKLNHGIKEQKHDPKFVNGMLEEIVLSEGISIKPLEIRKELHSLQMEEKDASARKQRKEEVYLKQVIQLLSHADAARDEEDTKAHYHLILDIVNKSSLQDGYISPYEAFRCPLSGSVMVDPVSLCTGTTFERAAIEALFEKEHEKDPCTGQLLDDLILRPNISLRQSIQLWREQNCCLKIRLAKEILQSQSANHSAYVNALCELEEVIEENKDCKDWIAIEGIIEIIVHLLETSDNTLKSRALQTLLAIVERHTQNKDKFVEAGGLNHIVKRKGLVSDLGRAVINLLFELLRENDSWYQATVQDCCRWNENLCIKLKQQDDAIAFLVVVIVGRRHPESSDKAEEILLKLCDDDDATIKLAAYFHWFKPLVQRLCNGTELSKLMMMKDLMKMLLVDEDIKQLGQDGVILPLVNLASGSAESSELAFAVLAKLSTSYENKRLMAEAGAVPLVLDQIFTSNVPTRRANCCEILEKLTSSGVEFLIDAGNAVPELEHILTKLIASLQFSDIQKTILKALLNVCKSAKKTAEMAIAATNGTSAILPLFENPLQEIRQLAVQLIHQLSQLEPLNIADFLKASSSGLQALMSFLEDDSQPELQIVTAGLLANLPKSNIKLTESLAELGAIQVLLKLLETGSVEAKENVLDSLFRFLDPTDIKMQRKVVNMGAYPLLVKILISGSMTAKVRAAALIGNLSSNSHQLFVESKRSRGKPISTCELHGAICSAESTFCVLKSGALPELVRLLQEHDNIVNLEALRTLRTLVRECRGAYLLHQYGAIAPMLYILTEGTPALIEEVLEILEMVFSVREVADKYRHQARTPLLELTLRSTGNMNENLKGKAARLLAELQRHSDMGSMPILNGK